MTQNTDNTVFVGDEDWLRNDYVSPVKVGGITFPTVEHAYQASKFTNRVLKLQIAYALTVRDARKIGRSNSDDLVDNWDDKRYSVMESLVRQKFQDPVLGERLVKTGTANIVMKGYDEYWGTGEDDTGENTLGDIFENIRSENAFLLGLNPEDYDTPPEPVLPAHVETESTKPSTLKDAILAIDGCCDNTELAEACQNLFEATQALMTTVDPNDFDAKFIARRTGVTLEKAEASIKILQDALSAVNTVKDLLSDAEDDEVDVDEEDEEEYDSEDEDDEDEDDDDEEDEYGID